MLNSKSTLLKLNKLCIHLLSSSVVAVVGSICGIIPEVSFGSSTVVFSQAAFAQQFTPEETVNYAKAGYEVELLRREVYQKIKGLMQEPPPNIVCNRRETIDNLQPNIRDIANNYCDRSLQIVRENNLTIDRYNELKEYYDRRDSFYEQVQNSLLRLQN